jgi:hypothetical protein
MHGFMKNPKLCAPLDPTANGGPPLAATAGQSMLAWSAKCSIDWQDHPDRPRCSSIVWTSTDAVDYPQGPKIVGLESLLPVGGGHPAE